jgi:hypothetical protein
VVFLPLPTIFDALWWIEEQDYGRGFEISHRGQLRTKVRGMRRDVHQPVFLSFILSYDASSYYEDPWTVNAIALVQKSR